MSLRERVLLGLSLATVVAVLALWHFTGEREKQLVWEPENKKLLTEPLHVAEAWLAHRGIDTSSVNLLDGLSWRDPNGAVLITRQKLGQHNYAEDQQLLQWVNRGGHLVIGASGTLSSRRLGQHLNPYNISRCLGCDSKADEDQPAETFAVETPDGTRLELFAPAVLRFGDGDGDNRRIDETLAQWRVDEQAAAIVRYPLGDGQVTVLADIGWLENRLMVYPDHVRLLETLVGQPEGIVYFQHRPAGGGLLSWLWHQAPVLWLAALGLLAVWVWSHLIRLGPITGSDRTAALQMREHLLATARFDWRYNRARQLIDAMREERSTLLQRRFPEWHRLDDTQRLNRVAALCPHNDPDSLAWLISVRELHAADDLSRYVSLHHDVLNAL